MNGIASPGYMANYRRQTDNHGKSMVGVQSIQKKALCVCCGVRRTEATGKHTKIGFVCHGCGRSA